MTTNTTLAVRAFEQTAITEFGWTDEDFQLVRTMLAEKATESEWKLFLYMARTYKLDPLLKQIWLIKWGNKPAQISVARDGYIQIGHRLKVLNGMRCEVRLEQVPFEVSYTQDNQAKTFKSDHQFVARASVWIKGCDYPFEVEVWEGEYSTGRDNWVIKRRTMISKVAESQALRRGLSVSGVYEEAELGEVVNNATGEITMTTPSRKRIDPSQQSVVDTTAREAPGATQAAPERPAEPKNKAGRRLVDHLRGFETTDAEISLLVGSLTGGRTSADLSAIEMSALADKVTSELTNRGDVDHALEEAARVKQAPPADDGAPATPEQLARLTELVTTLAWGTERVSAFLGALEVGRWEDLTVAEASEVIADLESRLPKNSRRAAKPAPAIATAAAGDGFDEL